MIDGGMREFKCAAILIFGKFEIFQGRGTGYFFNFVGVFTGQKSLVNLH